MKDLSEILVRKQKEFNKEFNKELKVTPSRKRNIDWEEATYMATYLKLSTPFIMKLFKKYGKDKVLSLQSYLKDFTGNASLEQALIYKLNQLS